MRTRCECKVISRGRVIHQTYCPKFDEMMGRKKKSHKYYAFITDDATAKVLKTWLDPIFNAFKREGLYISIQTEKQEWPESWSVTSPDKVRPEVKDKVRGKTVEFSHGDYTRVVIHAIYTPEPDAAA